jgi:hypothetical protein
MRLWRLKARRTCASVEPSIAATSRRHARPRLKPGFVSLAEALELTLLLAEGEPEKYDKTGSRPPGSLRRGVDADDVSRSLPT